MNSSSSLNDRERGMKQGDVLVDLAFPVDLSVLPLSLIRPGDVIDLPIG
jgi:hypothetical protein